MIYWVWLTTVPGIGAVTANRLLKEFETPENVYNADTKKLTDIKGITQKQAQSILKNRSLEKGYRILENCHKHNIHILTQNNSFYPKRAKKPEDAPIMIYYKGRLSALHQTVGIVGARRCTQEAKQQVVDLTQKLVSANVTIVSGMAKGIDAYAHTVCLKSGGSTVAVLGNGLDICYPREHNKLMECIINNGLVVSEYPPGTPPTKYHFPKRNRLISAWSDQLYVIAPGKGSGALITAEYAQRYGRKVFVLDGL